MKQNLKELQFSSNEMGILRLIEETSNLEPNTSSAKYTVLFIPHREEIETQLYYSGTCEVIAREIFEREVKEWSHFESLVNATKNQYSLDDQDFEPFELNENENNVIHVDFKNKVRLS